MDRCKPKTQAAELAWSRGGGESPACRAWDSCTACPECGTELPGDARFCSQCGHQMAEAKTGSGSVQARLQEGAQARGGMQGERRVVTMLFCDVAGSTAAAGQLDPEEWAEIMNGAFEYLIAPVYRYEGTLARLMGDAIFAFFGAPVTH